LDLKDVVEEAILIVMQLLHLIIPLMVWLQMVEETQNVLVHFVKQHETMLRF
jgi:hypothetical protein